jgi:hypothetical protein
VTEAEWLAGADPKVMLDFLRGKAGERRLRLFAVGYCRRVLPLLARWVEVGSAVDAAERYAEGALTVARLGQIGSALARYYPFLLSPASADEPTRAAFRIVLRAVAADAWEAPQEIVSNPAWGAERDAQARLLRCVFGNPLRPPTAIAPALLAWGGGTAVKLARAVNEERAFERLPILADALEEAGCSEAGLLTHLRGAGPHARGCWAVDRILGKG